MYTDTFNKQVMESSECPEMIEIECVQEVWHGRFDLKSFILDNLCIMYKSNICEYV